MNTRQKKKYVRKHIPKWVKHIDWDHVIVDGMNCYGLTCKQPKHPIQRHYREHVMTQTLMNELIQLNRGLTIDVDNSSVYDPVKRGIDMDPNKLLDNLLKYHGDVAGPGPMKNLSEYFPTSPEKYISIDGKSYKIPSDKPISIRILHDRNNHE